MVRNYAWLIILREDGAVSQAANAVWPFGPVQLLYNDAAILIGLVYSFLPFMILPIYAGFEKFDWRLLEAAYDLGANRRRALTRIIVPLAMPGIIAGSMRCSRPRPRSRWPSRRIFPSLPKCCAGALT